jgi:hypothetical protein
MCEEKCETNSELLPVSIFTTPPGTSEEFNTSENVTEHKGNFSEANTTQVLPPAITGAMALTKPISEELLGAIMPTTPVGSGTEKLKCEVATGFTEP